MLKIDSSYFACGRFPVSARKQLREEFMKAADARAADEDIYTDFLLYGMAVPYKQGEYGWVNKEYKEQCKTLHEYYIGLVSGQRNVHAFAYVRWPDHRTALMELSKCCNECGCKQHLHLF